jgi:hypothetical protein
MDHSHDTLTFVCLFVWWWLTPLSTIFQIYRSGQFYWWCNIKGYILDVDVNIVMGGWEVLMFTHFSTIFQLYRDCQFYWWRKPEYPEKTTDLVNFTHIFIKIRAERAFWYSFSVSILRIMSNFIMGHRGHDRMVVGFTITYAISAYHHKCCDFEYQIPLRRGY